MKVAILILLVFSQIAFAGSVATLRIGGLVPLVVTVTSKRLNKNTYEVKEVSNCRDGYTLILHTDAARVSYDGTPISVQETVTLTDVVFQDKTIEVTRILKVNSAFSFINLEIKPKE